MSDEKDNTEAPEESENPPQKQRKLIEQEPEDGIQHGRNAQRPDVNPPTNIQPGHRDREQI